ncbi:MAG: phosphoadenosine phosphosulfate reductase family protein [Rhodobacter sp.]|nr:phosphoadenosine phosphosulfate reductase family protein [Rhodobacter sp.]MCY4169791.1 phosphoadenosine phosphosulfate reductase family protein [Rhodobacter sp.]MCY4242101.1 phosphoadenosine phosphosulfate reductase family protein [Rhodobacter sp.]
MPPEPPFGPVAGDVDGLNRRFRHHSAFSLLRHVLTDAPFGHTALVSSFGAESVALLHMVSALDRSVPVLFLDSGPYFPETVSYQRRICQRLGLTSVRTIRPDPEQVFLRDPDGILHLFDRDACRRLRKTEPLQAALRPFDAWISDRRRGGNGVSGETEYFECGTDGRIMINPLAFWDRQDVLDYIDGNALPRHPLVADDQLAADERFPLGYRVHADGMNPRLSACAGL